LINGLIVTSGRGYHFPEFATLRVAKSLVSAAWELDNAFFIGSGIAAVWPAGLESRPPYA
jgi:hypothetical protein